MAKVSKKRELNKGQDSSSKRPRKRQSRKEVPPPPRLKFIIRLKANQNIDKARDCIEITLGTKLTEVFPDLLRFKESIWSYDPRDKKKGIEKHYINKASVEKKKRELAKGRPVGLPIRLEAVAQDAKKFVPKLGKEIIKERFLVLTLPIFMRNHRRTACNPNGILFDAAYILRDSCGFASVTPSLPHPIGLQSAFFGTLFPPRPAPTQLGIPDTSRWHLFNIRAITPTGNSIIPAVTGIGVTIGHPDTGWTRHPQLNFNSTAPGGTSPNFASPGLSLLNPAATSAIEPVPAPAIPLTNPFHGTRTSSLMISSTMGQGNTVAGIAPGASIVSIRCVRDVIILYPEIDDELIASAVIAAVTSGAQVISISLGGYPSEFLRWAIQWAVLNNVIVVAAAGNYWPVVVYPAGYPECIGVGGCTADDLRWPYSSRNWNGLSQIDISAPSEFVSNATWTGAGTPTTTSNSGTSFGTAIVAGAAALWLQNFGRAALITALGGRTPLQALFQVHLRITARTPVGWNTFLDGPGILNLSALLNPRTLPNPTTFPIPPSFTRMLSGLANGSNLATGELLAAPNLTGNLPPWMRSVFNENAQEIISNFAEEVMHLMMENPVVSGLVDAANQTAQVAEEAAQNASAAAQDAVDAAQDAAEEAAETASEVAEAVVDTVSDTVSDSLAAVAGWF